MIDLSAAQPYVGLRPFNAEDSLFFFGRRDQVGELLDRLHDHSFLAVVGSSGCGKSSLIRAGLIPALLGGFLVEERDKWSIAVMKPGDAPLWNLARSVVEATGDAKDSAPRESIEQLKEDLLAEHDEAIAERVREALPPNANLLLLVDQFEELFEFRSRGPASNVSQSAELRRQQSRRRGEASDFVDLLLRLARKPEIPVYVVITMRSDFLGDCDVFYGLPEAMNQGRYLVPRLTRDQLRDAVEGPALVAQATVAPRLLDTVLNELGNRSDHLPVLQHAMLRTWDAWKRSGADGPLDLTHYEESGGLESALSKHANEAVTSANEPLVEVIFKRLTDTDAGQRRIRRRSTLEDLVAVSGASREEVLDVIEEFRGDGRNFLVLSEQEDHANPRVDISHESLIRQWSQLAGWVDEERENRDIYLSLVKRTHAHQQGDEGWLDGPALARAAEWRGRERPSRAWASRYTPSGDEIVDVGEYIDQSTRFSAANRRKRQFQTWGLVAAACVIGGLVALVWFAFSQQERARQQQALAEQNLAQAQSNLARILEEKAGLALREDHPGHAWTYTLASLDALPKDQPPRSLPQSMGRLLQPDICPGPDCAPDPREANLNSQGTRRDGRTWASRAAWLDAAGVLHAAAVLECRGGEACPPGFAIFSIYRGSVSGAILTDELVSERLPVTYLAAAAQSAAPPRQRGQQVQIESLTASVTGTAIAAGTTDGVVRVWRTEQPYDGHGLRLAPDKKLDAPQGAARRVTSLAFSAEPTPNHLAASYSDGSVAVWDLRTSAAPVTSQTPDADLPALAMAFSPDGTRLALGNAAGILAWEHRERDDMDAIEFVVPDPSRHEELEPILSLAFTPNGNCLAAGRSAGRVSLYCFLEDDITGHEVFEATEGTGRIDGINIDPTRKIMLTSGGDGSVHQAALNLRLYGDHEWDLLEFFSSTDLSAQRDRLATEYAAARERFSLHLNEHLDLRRTPPGDGGAPSDADPNTIGFLDPEIRARYYPTRSEAGKIAPINESGQFEWQDRFCHFRRVSLNGEGNVLRVRPGADVSLSFSWEAGVRPSKKAYCPTCIVQFYVGIHGHLDSCLFSEVMQPAYFRGRSAKFQRKFQAPPQPGVYYLTFRHTLLYGCQEDTNAQPEDPSKAFAALIVE